ncbi:MAG: prephenate dehydrogenase/arogenate dehydrogenase family protein [Ruminococcaceae bacterium]|nr:prephenate dehydrogenase/arogenate dehydrogenase family protein [Oscillospiraceae bacterium]
MENSDFKIGIIGLGIIGGSMAYALHGFRNALIYGCDINPDTRKKALERGAVDFVSENARDAIENADIVILCTYPELIVKIIKENKDFFKPGALITDVCGVKTKLAREIEENLPTACEYVGGHPMAGKETDGFDSAAPELFGMCGFIITPVKSSTEKGIKTVREIARYIGATRITESTPEDHDSVIAYTSDLMHISAACLCLDYNNKMNRAYTAGAFRDCTRIANINPGLWTQLFLENHSFLLDEIDRFQASLTKMRDAIATQNDKELFEMLKTVRDNKLTMQSKEPE